MHNDDNTSSVQSGLDHAVRLVELPEIRDPRGALTFAQVPDHLPFTPQRYFLLYDLQENVARGAHAHRQHHQFLVCVHGTARVTVDDALTQREYELATPAHGLYVAPMTWVTVVPSSVDAVMLVLTSAPYDAADYVRDQAEFARLRSR